MREIGERRVVETVGYVKGLFRRVVFGKPLRLYPSEALEPGEVRVVEESQLAAYSQGIYLHPINYYYLRYVDDETVRDGFAIASVQAESWMRQEWDRQFQKANERIEARIYSATKTAAYNLVDNLVKFDMKQRWRDRRADELIRSFGLDPNVIRRQNRTEEPLDLNLATFTDYKKFWPNPIITPEEARRNILADHIVP